MQILSRTLDSLEIGTPISAAHLTMVPLLAPAPADPDYLLLDDALDAGLAEVTELSQGGSVPELAFRNRADRDVLLVDGEELVGAKQNRVLNLTILVAAGEQVTIPVSCVEAGRWSWRSQRFASGRRKLHASARWAKMRGVSASLREAGRRAGGEIQHEVWASIDRKISAFACRSESRALHDVYDHAEDRLRAIRTAFAAQPRQVGAVFFIDNALAGLDLYDTPFTLAKLLPKLVDSYAFDAIERADEAAQRTTPSLAEIRALLARIAAAPHSAYPAVATGTDVRIEGDGLHAAALCAKDRLVHLSAFCTDAQAGQ
ncbi:MAG: hypothetical protein N3D71_09930 [Burkholderiaceae bacterium]|nr:hypothetical protein [Burkholderiaceae bacterium]